MTNFKPSQVDLLSSFPPLVGTMGKCESEVAAAIIVRVCQETGDVWAPVSPLTFKKVLTDDVIAKRDPLFSINTNQFAQPDFRQLVAAGYARWVESDSPTGLIELTDAGIAALRRWVKPEGAQ